MRNIVFLRIGGVFHLLCAVTHIFFPAMFRWNDRLRPLAGEDLVVIDANLRIMNICLLVMWVMLAYIPLFHSRDMLEKGIGRSILFFIVMFWLIRIFVLQPMYGGYGSAEVVVAMIVFTAGMLMFALPLVSSFRNGARER